MIHNVGYREHTKKLFLKSQEMKLFDLVQYKTSIIVFKARKNDLPSQVQKLFHDREGGYYLRREFNLKEMYAKKVKKRQCLSVCGVKMWNTLSEEIKRSTNIHLFKKHCKTFVLSKYDGSETENLVFIINVVNVHVKH